MDVAHDTLAYRGLAVPALRATPSGDGPHPGVMLVHDAWGLDDEAAALAAALAGAGFAVLAPDLLRGRQAADAEEARALAAGLDAEDAALLLATAVDALADDSATRAGPVGVVGLGMGSPLAAFIATIRPAVGVAVLAGPVPDLSLEAWSAATADLVVVAIENGAEADASDPAASAAVDPAVALDRARAAGRRVTVVEARREAELAPLILEALAAQRGAG